MAGVSLPLQRSFGETARRDWWWIQPGLVLIALSCFIVYATWAAFENKHYTLKGTNYLSPFYAPEILGASDHAWFGPAPAWWPSWLPFSPALLILWAPAGFRVTCYYYRGAYYKAFWADPPACAVGEPRQSYIGESGWPLKIQNLHRYFLYLAFVFLAFLYWDVLWSYFFEGRFGIGVGSIVLTVNVLLLTSYTLGCHSFRHLAGGRIDCLSRSPSCHSVYKCASALNRKHMVCAWLSLFSVMFADIYIRLCSMGVWRDVRLW